MQGKPAAWSTVKKGLADLDRRALVALVKELWEQSKENRAYLSARFPTSASVTNALEPFRRRMLELFDVSDRRPDPGQPTTRQREYLEFIHHYTKVHRVSPAEGDMQRYFGTSAPAIHNMVLRLESRGWISRTPGQARSIRLLVDPAELRLE